MSWSWAGIVAAKQSAGAGTEDELVARVITAAPEDGALHGGEDVALEGAGAGELDSLVQSIVRQRGGTAVHVDLGGGFDATKGTDQIGGVDQAGNRCMKRAASAVGEADSIGFIADGPVDTEV